MENIFSSIKEFIWDIIGYVIPGACVLILLEIIFKINLPLDKGHFLFIISSYIIGHIIYGMNVFFYEKRDNTNNYRNKSELEVKERQEYAICLQKLNKKLNKEFDKESNIRTIRSLTMSYIPESDTKIYTFTFRAELSNSCSTVLLIFGIIGYLCSLISHFNPEILSFFKNFDYNWILFYSILVINSVFLKFTRNKFYKMSISLPFSILATKEL
jgi:hypothetical protein